MSLIVCYHSLNRVKTVVGCGAACNSDRQCLAFEFDRGKSCSLGDGDNLVASSSSEGVKEVFVNENVKGDQVKADD